MTETLISRPGGKLWSAQDSGRVVTPGDAMALRVPSGQGVMLQETIMDSPSPDAVIYRFRYLAPAIARAGGTMNFAASIGDMQHLCEKHVLPNIAVPFPASLQVIVSFADMPLPFGETNPEVTQFFVAYRVKDGLCILEPF